jgi:hypothetical protein
MDIVLYTMLAVEIGIVIVLAFIASLLTDIVNILEAPKEAKGR